MDISRDAVGISLEWRPTEVVDFFQNQQQLRVQIDVDDLRPNIYLIIILLCNLGRKILY